MKTAKELLSRVPCFVVTDAAMSEMKVHPMSIWKQVIKYGATPVSRISVEVSSTDIEKWLFSICKNVMFGSKLYCCLDGYGQLPWIEVESICLNPLFEIWKACNVKEMVLLDPSTGNVVGIVEDEYYYEEHRMNVLSQI